MDQISQQAHFQRRMTPEVAEVTRSVILRSVNKARVPVTPILGETKLLLSDIARLQVGDVVALNTGCEDPITVEVGGIPRFLARPGKRKEQSAVQLVSVIRD